MPDTALFMRDLRHDVAAKIELGISSTHIIFEVLDDAYCEMAQSTFLNVVEALGGINEVKRQIAWILVKDDRPGHAYWRNVETGEEMEGEHTDEGQPLRFEIKNT